MSVLVPQLTRSLTVLEGAPQAPRAAAGAQQQEPPSAGSSIESSSAETPPPLVLTRESKIQLAMLLGSGTLLQLGTGMIVPCLPFCDLHGLTPADVGVGGGSLLARALGLPAGRVADIVGRKKPVMGTLADGIAAWQPHSRAA